MNMKKKVGLITLLLLYLLLLIKPIDVYAAELGQTLSAPEDGWKRYDDLNSLFYYQGTWESFNNGSKSFYNGGMMYAKEDSVGDLVRFKFKGSKLRIIQQIWDRRSESIQVKIDDTIVGTYSLYHPNYITDQCLVYEINNLTSGIHKVELLNLDNTKSHCFDAIDIDSTGELLPYGGPENLKAIGGDSKIELSWSDANNSASYIVRRSETAGGPYTTIASDVTGMFYTDSNVTIGTTYYYIVSSIASGVEIASSNEASAQSTTEHMSSKLKVVLEVSESLKLSIDDDLNKNIEMSWSSSDENVASVNEKGIITALLPGNTIIAVKSTDGSYSDYINVLVVEDAGDYRLAIDIKVGQSTRLTIDNLTNTINTTWAPMDSSIANVTSKGKITALNKGLVLITAKDEEGNIIGQVYVRVRE